MLNNSRRIDHNKDNRINWGNDSDSYGRSANNNRPFKINQAVRHIGTGIRLIVIKYGREQIECRKPDLSSEYFYVYELEAWPEDTK